MNDDEYCKQVTQKAIQHLAKCSLDDSIFDSDTKKWIKKALRYVG